VFYAYNGAYSDELQESGHLDYANQLWQFSPSGNSGVWSNVTPSADSIFSTLNRTAGGTYFSGNGIGFALSGARATSTDPTLTETMLVSV
jgi:hypothetical protein